MTFLIKILSSLLLATLVIQCTADFVRDEIPKENELRHQIIEAISFDASQYDTIIYEYLIAVCGNSPDDEINSLYNPLLNEKPFDTLLSKKLNAAVLIGDINNRNLPTLKITGTIENKTMHVTESLVMNELIHLKTNTFKFKNESWILDNSNP